MKILILSSYAPTLFFFREDMISEMLKRGHEVIAAAPESRKEWAVKFEKRGIKYTTIAVERTGTNPLKDLITLFSILKVILKEKPDKIFTYQAKTVIYGCMAAKISRIADVYVLMGGLGSVFRSEIKRNLAKGILKIEYKIAMKCCKFVFFQNSDDSSEMLKAGIVARRKIIMINGSGVNLDKFIPKPLPSEITFLFVGRIIRDKGINEYISAAKIVKQVYPQTRVQIVGYFDSNPTAIKEEEIKANMRNGIIEYLGATDDVRPYLEKCSVFVLPSYHEGTPKSVLEAMATGRPIITTDAPGCRETVIDGRNGFKVPVKNVDELAKKMIWMIENRSELEKMGQESLKMCREKFDVNVINQIILNTMDI
ncbi:glycosyltransferase family 4 protein [Sporomusa sphaeroides]|uniref:glycosyltransferase family 4 protein n=1 Tax=Sporomusa sphaeroides TaxID=47679 RepID=UPI002CE517A5|nr:glycosyltransferase family 4 protein [Sporomusa sphaeroides]HML34166.1 glycosyltransferase family 4 protein [Sporomusa sphaeroides]